MNLNRLTGITPSVAETGTSPDDVVELTMLKKAMDVESATATAIVDAVPPPQSLPDHLGRHINTKA